MTDETPSTAPCADCGGRNPYRFGTRCTACWQRRRRRSCTALTEAEVAERVAAAVRSFDPRTTWSDEIADLVALIAFRGLRTDGVAEAALDAGVLWPGVIYRGAGDVVVRRLMALLTDAPSSLRANHLLCCLAQAGGDEVLAAFVGWEAAPPAGWPSLHVPPSVYAREAGWTFDQDGARIALTFDECRAVLPEPGPRARPIDADGPAAVRVATPRDDRCAHCSSPLIDVLTLDGRDPSLAFLGLDGVVRIPVCPSCATMCERTEVWFALDGTSSTNVVDPFAEDLPVAEQDYAEMTGRVFSARPEPVPECFALAEDESVVTIGGLPSWVQDAAYADCPDCAAPMRHLASVPWTALVDPSEGTLYLQLCAACQVVVGVHQQT
jgi:hypothetical protein